MGFRGLTATPPHDNLGAEPLAHMYSIPQLQVYLEVSISSTAHPPLGRNPQLYPYSPHMWLHPGELADTDVPMKKRKFNVSEAKR